MAHVVPFYRAVGEQVLIDTASVEYLLRGLGAGFRPRDAPCMF